MNKQQNDNYLTKISICYLNKATVCRNKFKPEKQEMIKN